MALQGLSRGDKQEFSLECLSLSDNRGEPGIQDKPRESMQFFNLQYGGLFGWGTHIG